MGKNIRFAQLVKTSGRPEVVTLWQKPDDDPRIKNATRQNRILTVRQETVGNKKDFGEIGFKKASNASYLIFPKPLPKTAEDARVIGINYEMVEAKLQPEGKGTGSSARSKRAKNKKETSPKRAAIPAQKVEEEFSLVVRKTAVWETTVKIKAPSKAQAAAQAEQRFKKEFLPLSEAIVEVKIREAKT